MKLWEGFVLNFRLQSLPNYERLTMVAQSWNQRMVTVPSSRDVPGAGAFFPPTSMNSKPPWIEWPNGDKIPWIRTRDSSKPAPSFSRFRIYWCSFNPNRPSIRSSRRVGHWVQIPSLLKSNNSKPSNPSEPHSSWTGHCNAMRYSFKESKVHRSLGALSMKP